METTDNSFDVAGVRFDPATGVLAGAYDTCKLEPRAADVLGLLLRERGTLVTRQRLLDECWGEGTGSDEALTQAIAQIRRSLEALDVPRDLLTTYPKRGYRLSAAERTSSPEPKRKARIPAWVPLTMALAAAVLILAIAPGYPRHAIRHALGLGPQHAHHGAAGQAP